jgi:molecular chaperone HscB
MSSPISAPTLQACRNCGAGASLDAHFCPQCTKILPLQRQADYFSFLGLPRLLNIDADDLDRRFRALSRQFHPDYFYNATPAERRASLERSSYLNDAYRTLRQPATRIEYLLKLEGLAPKNPAEASRQVPPGMLEEVFALNEELDEIRELRAGGGSADQCRERLERARLPINAKRVEHEVQLQELSTRWDALVDGGAAEAERRAVLNALRGRFLERNYITNLLATIERELAQ